MRDWLEKFAGHVVEHPWADVAVLGWLIVAISTMVAVFSPRVRDTAWERICLAGISIGAFSRAAFIFSRETIPIDGAWTAITLAAYCIVLWWKYYYVIPRRRDFKSDREIQRIDSKGPNRGQRNL